MWAAISKKFIIMSNTKLFLDAEEVIIFVKKAFRLKCKITVAQVFPGYILDRYGSGLRQPAWKIVLGRKQEMFVSMQKDRIQSGDFYSESENNGYILQDGTFLYLQENNEKTKKFVIGQKSGVRYYML